MTDQLKALWKRLISYTKTTWKIDDYPLRYRKQINTTEPYNIDELKPWVVQIINWWVMTGLGETKKDAYEHLKSSFKNYLEYKKAPRPGTSVPLSFAATLQIDQLETVAVE